MYFFFINFKNKYNLTVKINQTVSRFYTKQVLLLKCFFSFFCVPLLSKKYKLIFIHAYYTINYIGNMVHTAIFFNFPMVFELQPKNRKTWLITTTVKIHTCVY